MKKALKITGSILFWVILGAILSVTLLSGIDRLTNYKAPFFGLRSTVIISNSMSLVHQDNKDDLDGITNQLHKNDLIMTKMVSFEELEKHDIITYYYKGSLVCHRLINKEINEDGQQLLFTRGDANKSMDPVVNFTEFRGVVYNVVPKIGGFSLFLQSPYGLLAISVSIVSVVGGILIGGYVKKKKDGNKLESEDSSKDTNENDL